MADGTTQQTVTSLDAATKKRFIADVIAGSSTSRQLSDRYGISPQAANYWARRAETLREQQASTEEEADSDEAPTSEDDEEPSEDTTGAYWLEQAESFKARNIELLEHVADLSMECVRLRRLLEARE